MKSRLYVLIALAAIGALLYALGWVTGAGHEQDKAKALAAEQLRQAFEQGQALGQIRDRVVTEYVDRVEVVETRGKTIIKEVPIYVTPDDDSRCAVPAGFVRLHDAAAGGMPIDPAPGPANAAPSGVALSTVAGTVAGNYTACHANAEQLRLLQEYVSERESIFNQERRR